MTATANTEILGCWIDPCYPRTPRERCYRMLDLLDAVCDGGMSEAAQAMWQDEIEAAHEDFVHEVEQGIEDKVNELLPEGLICTTGEAEPGCVIVREIEEEDYS